MASKAKSRVLTEHHEIRGWAEQRGARPSTVRKTYSDDNKGIIRLDFPGYSGAESLKEISWDEWFEDFDSRNLALVVQDETADGNTSNFNKLVSREGLEGASEDTSAKERSRGTSARSSSTRSSSKRSASQTARKSRARGPSRSTSSKSRTGRKQSAQAGRQSSRRKAA
jgi:hypothetical protein